MKAVAFALFVLVATSLPSSSFPQTYALNPPELTTPERVESRLGQLQFRDGIPTAKTAEKIYAYLDFSRGVETFLNGFSGVSMYAIRKGFRDSGVKDNDILIFSGLMDSKSLFLTANADTIYFWGYLDLSKGPMVVEVPPESLGIFDDMWFRWILDFGLAGPDRGQGGKYLVLPPGYDGPLPEGGYFIAHSRTNGVGLIARTFLDNNDPTPAVARIKAGLKIYPYVPGSYGSSIGAFLNGKGPLGQLSTPASPRFVEGTGRVMNTVPPNDTSFYEMLDALVQEEPAEALDPELAGQFAAIGIVKGRPFKPNDRLRKVLTEAAALGNAASRTIGTRARAAEGFTYYPDSFWSNPLFAGGYEFMNPPPEITKKGVKPYPSTGARALDARTSFFYLATVITPAMVMRLTNIGSQYLGTFYDAKGNPLDGAKTYKVMLPPNIPAAKFWSFTVYDNQSRSMLQTAQRFPRAGSQSFPTPAAVANAVGSTAVYFSPRRPVGVPEGNWIQTTPGKGWFVLLRLYSPLQSFFDKSWRPGEIELVN
ncbi:MAG: DUF1254 domain-containing protein [Methylocella sp.]